MAAAAAESGKIQRQGLTPRHVLVLFTCMLGTLVPTAIVYTAGGLCFTPVSNALGVERSQVTIYLTMVFLANLIMAVPMANLFDRFPIKIFVPICTVMVGLPYFLMGFYDQIWQWWISGFIIGAGLVCVEFTTTAGVLSKWFHTKYGFVIGLTFACTGLGGIIFNLWGQSILGVDLSGWRDLYHIFGLVILIVCIPFQVLFLKRTPQECGLLPYGLPIGEGEEAAVKEIDPATLPGWTFAQARRMPIFWMLGILGGILCSITQASQMFSTYVQFLGHEGWGGAAIAALLLLSGTLEAFASGGQAGGKVIIGAVESWNLVAALVLGAVGGIVGLLMIWWIPILMGESGIWIMFCGGAVYGLVYALSTAGIPFITREVFGSKDYDRVYSVVIAVFNGIGAIGVTAWALIQENAGWDGYFIAAIGLIVIMLILGLYIAKHGYKLREEASNAWYTPEVELQQTGRIRSAKRRAAYVAAHPEAAGQLEVAVEKG